MYALVREPIDVTEAIRAVAGPDAGAIALFLGTVREENAGRRVLSLEYEAYPGMAERVMARIGDEIAAHFGACRVAMIHRVGPLAIGETSVVVAVSAPHRATAFEACRHGVERLKQIVPIWKKEYFEGGEVWVENACPAGREDGPGNEGSTAAFPSEEKGWARGTE